MDLARSHYRIFLRLRRVILKDAGGVVVLIITILWITIQYLAPLITHAPVTRIALLARTSTHLGPPAKLAQVADTKTKLRGHHAKSTLTTVVLVILLLLIKNHA